MALAPKKITELDAAGTLTGAEELPVVQGGENRRVSIASVLAFFASSSTLADGSVTNAKLANMATARFKGRTTAGTGVPEDLTVAQVKTMLAYTAADVGASATGHTHAAASITDFSAAADARIAAASINALSDVTITAPSTGQVIKWDGSQWVNGTDETGGGGAGVTDGDKGDIVVSASGTVWSLDASLLASLLARGNHTGTQDVTTITGLTEAVQDIVAAFLVAGSNITLTYDDAGNALTIAGTGGGGGVSDGDKGDIVVSASGVTWTIDAGVISTAKIADDAVTYAKFQNVSAASRLLGRGAAAGSGDVQEISLGAGLSLNGGTTLANIESIIVAAGDESTAITTGTSKVTFRMPYAFTLTGVRASLKTAQTSGVVLTVDINEGGASVLGTKLTFDNTEKTTVTAATAATITDTSLADDAEITVDVDQVGDGTAVGLKIVLIGYRP